MRRRVLSLRLCWQLMSSVDTVSMREPEPPAPPEPEPEPPAEAPEDDAVTEAAALMDRVMEAAIKEN